ncbi:OmpA family protein [Actinomyces naeslundii]|uniref:OmpA family protein n=1 Tax=Actinomyces naeslundii TaxID=1655 RepID=A0AA47IPK6_ACTNA|nr:OmpA family protein [Actinomyces naeslundii]OMG11841.1 flagellar motor protein MotB [Actinomyces naeslundii]OMG16250.1 flagellar motor protein MotB [Actinomyces naeslundii]PKY94638.1 OmpA family protein [Actinomyces naeslundii]WAL42995.1 OmpA family protein [Actinomyces naeslundii]
MAFSVLAGVGLPVLAGCDLPGASKGKDSASANGSASAKGKAKAGSTDWQELDAHIMGHKVAVRVSPVIRKNDTTSIMALELTRAKDDASIDRVKTDSSDTEDNKLNISSYLGTPSIYRPGTGASLVKLLDLGSGRVWSATDGSGTDNNGYLEITPGEKTTSYLSFGKVDTDTVTVMVPMTGFTTVAVLEADAAKKASIDLDAASSNLDQFPDAATELAKPATIERYTRALDDSTSTHTGDKDVTVTLASDVTFASDSADLTPAADTQLQTVADQLDQYPDGGTLTIVGHTDDVQDDAYNQTLSDKRANAVKTKLQQLTNLDKWNPTTTGKGESEPRVKDTTDEARAANRRVEITLTPTGGTNPKDSNTTATPSSSSGSGGGKLPDPQGPVAKGPEGITLTSKDTDTSSKVTITLDHLTRQDGYLLGTITCAIKDGSTGAPLHPLLEDPQTLLANQRDEDGSALPTFNASDGLTLIAGGERIFPADYLDADAEHHLPLTELNISDHLKTGTTTICTIWPDPGGDTIALDHPDGKYAVKDTAYRLTDIPIKNS